MEFSDAEWRIMREVWHWPSVTSRQVHSALHAETGWAYSTVKTMLTRLVEKGALRMSRDGNRSVFEPLVTRSQARAEAILRRPIAPRAVAEGPSPLRPDPEDLPEPDADEPPFHLNPDERLI